MSGKLTSIQGRGGFIGFFVFSKDFGEPAPTGINVEAETGFFASFVSPVSVLIYESDRKR